MNGLMPARLPASVQAPAAVVMVRPHRFHPNPETAADNEASNRVLAGAGFTVWGREEAADAPDGSVGPALHWERLA